MLEVLFDHCTPDPLKDRFGREIKVDFARKRGLEMLRNSELEKKAHELGYNALITVDTDFGKPEHPLEYHLPVVLLRAFPLLAEFTVSVLIHRVKGKLLGGADPGLYIWDNYKGKIRAARSLAKSDELRKEAEAELEAEMEAKARQAR